MGEIGGETHTDTGGSCVNDTRLVVPVISRTH